MSYETTGIVDVFVVIPKDRPIPNKIVVRTENHNDNPSYPMKVYREFVIMHHKENAFAAKTWSMAMSCLLSGRLHERVASEQRTGRFNICFSAAHDAQQYDKQELPEILNEIIIARVEAALTIRLQLQ